MEEQAKPFSSENPFPISASLDHLAALVGLKTTAGRIALEFFVEQAVLLDKKQQDYGPNNITAWGELGVLVRMTDKFERLKHLMSVKRRKPRNEKIADSLMDIANYAIIALMLRANKWPTT